MLFLLRVKTFQNLLFAATFAFARINSRRPSLVHLINSSRMMKAKNMNHPQMANVTQNLSSPLLCTKISLNWNRFGFTVF
ncbi:MAG: hypothetical protein H7Z37_12650 [Pyrinomonadaceae bacterium]|nr:hypothetical protein [Pyrinomonadaceae bacterium]